MPGRLLTYQEAADVLGISTGTLHWWVHEKKIPHIRYGPRLVRFDEDVIVAWIAERIVDPREET